MSFSTQNPSPIDQPTTEPVVPVLLGVNIIAGDGLAGGGPTTADVTLSLESLAPSPAGTYTSLNATIDAHGRVTHAANGSAGVLAHNALTGIQGGITNQYYHLTATEYAELQLGYVPLSRTIGVVSGQLTGGGDLSSDRTLGLATTTVAAGSYSFANFTVDVYGRITAASSTLLSAIDHNSLNNLAVGDVHTQYVYKNGRSGGQTVVGGTIAADYLKLVSTSGTGTTDYISLCVGDNGGTEGLRVGPTGATTITSLLTKGPRADVRAYGAVGNGVTDDTAAVQAALTANKVVYFPAPSVAYLVSNLTIQTGQVLMGDGFASVIKFKNGSTGYMIEADGKVLQVVDLKFDGGNDDNYEAIIVPGNRSGVHFDVTQPKNLVHRCAFTGWNNIAIGYNGDTSPVHDGLVIADSFISRNYVGIDTAPGGVTHETARGTGNGGEYTKIIGNTLNQNFTAIVASAGNTNITANSISTNGYGIYINGAVPNAGHGNIVGNLINHSSGYSLYFKDLAYGESVVGNQLYYGAWHVENCSDVTVMDCGVIAYNMELIGTGHNSFSHNTFRGASPSITGGAGNISWDSNFDSTIVGGGYVGGTTSLLVDPLTTEYAGGRLATQSLYLGGAALPQIQLTSQALLATPEKGGIEFYQDAYYGSLTTSLGSYASHYPIAQDGVNVRATSYYNSTIYEKFAPYNATNPATPLDGDPSTHLWCWTSATTTPQRFHIDLRRPHIVTRFYYENAHFAGAATDIGAKTFTLWGSNAATSFAELTYGTDTGWTQLTTSQGTLDQHAAADAADPKYVTVTNTTPYRYYAFKFADNWGNATFMGLRRVELQSGVPGRYNFIQNTPTVQFDGKVGIGTAAPATALDVANAGQNTALISLRGDFYSLGATANNVGFDWYAKNNANASTLYGRAIVYNVNPTAGAETGVLRLFAVDSGDISEGTLSVYGKRVGIGTNITQPLAPLQVNTAAATSVQEGVSILNKGGTGAGAAIRFLCGNNTEFANITGANDAGNSSYLAFSTWNGTLGERVRINKQGYVGINNTDPQCSLHVSADALIGAPDTYSMRLSSFINKDKFVGIGYDVSINPTGGGVGFITSIYAGVVFTPLLLNPFGGNVGIGIQVAPTQQLELSESMTMPATTSATTGVVYKGANRFIHDYKAPGAPGSNTYAGVGSGNFSLTACTGNQGSYNAGFGHNVLANLTTGAFNVGLGSDALEFLTTGDMNMATGYRSMYALVGGSNNTGYGAYTLGQCVSGGNNVAIGTWAGYAALGSNNVFIGYQAGYYFTGSDTVLIGFGAGDALVGGVNNTAVGHRALSAEVAGTDNTAIGYGTLAISNGGVSNTAVGSGALGTVTTGDYNVGIGTVSGQLISTGSCNMCVGYGTMYDAGGSASNNVAVGVNSLYRTTGHGSVAIGYTAGAWNSGAGNVFIGNAAGHPDGGVGSILATSNLLYIHNAASDTPLIGGDFSAHTLALTATTTINPSSTPTSALVLDIAAPATNSVVNSHAIQWNSRSDDGTPHSVFWRQYASPFGNDSSTCFFNHDLSPDGGSTWLQQFRYGIVSGNPGIFEFGDNNWKLQVIDRTGTANGRYLYINGGMGAGGGAKGKLFLGDNLDRSEEVSVAANGGKLGFYGTAPVAQQLLAATGITTAQISTILFNLGLTHH